MSENLKKFLEAVSQNEELVAKVNAETDQDALIALAMELGITLNAADFEDDCELDDDDLDAVAGGQRVNCSCAVGGGGTGDDNDKTCACVLAGAGMQKSGGERCFCPLAGFGYDY